MKSERFVGTGVAGPSTASAISKIKGIEQQLNQEVNVLVDVAWSPESSYVTGVAYNTGGKLLSRSKPCPSHTPAQAESKALVLAAQIACSNGWSSVNFFSDANEVVAFVNHRLNPF